MGAGGSTQIDGGSTNPVDSGLIDSTEDDAQDAPAIEPDAPSGNDAVGLDSGTPGNLDSGSADEASLDSEAIDTVVVLLDAELDTEKFDVVPDVAADGPADTALKDTAPGNCVQQVIADGYAFGAANPCSVCRENAGQQNPLETECKGMLDCLNNASCIWTSDSCWFACRNAVGPGNQVNTGDCVLALMTAASCPATRSH